MENSIVNEQQSLQVVWNSGEMELDAFESNNLNSI